MLPKGWRSGELEVQGMSSRMSGNRHYYFALCHACGKVVELREDKFINRLQVSCGDCALTVRQWPQYKKPDVETGYIIGDFEVGKRVPTTNRAHMIYFECQCIHCGLIKPISKTHLNSGQNTCICRRMSHGARGVKNALIQLELQFQTEYRHILLPQYSFDFAYFDKDNMLAGFIEFDGIQHTQPVAHWGGEEGLRRTQERDKAKNEFCEKMGIPLLRVPYYETDGSFVIRNLRKIQNGDWSGKINLINQNNFSPETHPEQHLI